MHLRGWRSFQNPSGSRAEQCGTADIFHTLNRLYSTLSPQHVEWGVEVIKLGILAILSNFIFFSLFDIKEVFGSQFQEKVNEGELQLGYLKKKKKKHWNLWLPSMLSLTQAHSLVSIPVDAQTFKCSYPLYKMTSYS